jgi:hypothetical protein
VAASTPPRTDTPRVPAAAQTTSAHPSSPAKCDTCADVPAEDLAAAADAPPHVEAPPVAGNALVPAPATMHHHVVPHLHTTPPPPPVATIVPAPEPPPAPQGIAPPAAPGLLAIALPADGPAAVPAATRFAAHDLESPTTLDTPPSGGAVDDMRPDSPAVPQPSRTGGTPASGGAAAGGGGGSAPIFLVTLCIIAAFAQATRALVRPRFTSRSVALVLIVERPG